MRKSIVTVVLVTLILSGLGEPTRWADSSGQALAAGPPQPFLLKIGDVRSASGRVPRGFGKLGLSKDQKERIYGMQPSACGRGLSGIWRVAFA